MKDLYQFIMCCLVGGSVTLITYFTIDVAIDHCSQPGVDCVPDWITDKGI